jgi:SAM-dependent methyltransferase
VSWDPVWEEVFRGREWGRYPPEELIRFVARSYGEERSRILELGCGVGANLWYLAREGHAATGIDGSETALAKARERLETERLEAELLHGDFTDLAGRVGVAAFDGVIDVAAVQCNRVGAAAEVFRQVREALRPGGRVFSMLVAAGSWGDGTGEELEPRTYVDISEGPLVGTGVCHFYELDEVERLFAGFEDVVVEYSERSLDGRRQLYRHWVVTAVRPG